jgi:hypothetical protein
MLCKSMDSPSYLCDAFNLFLLESKELGQKDVFCMWKAFQYRVFSDFYYTQSKATELEV